MDINIRPFRKEEDKKQILDLLNYVFQKQQRSDSLRNESFYNWKFLDSPFGESIVTLAETKNKIVGVDTLWPWQFDIGGKTINAMQPCNTVVHPDAWGQGIFKKMRIFGVNQAINKGDVSFLFNFPNNNSIQGNLSLGWKFVGKIPWWIKIINPLNTFKSYIYKGKTTLVNVPQELHLSVSDLDRIHSSNSNYNSLVKIHRVKGFHQYRYLQGKQGKYGMIMHEEGNKSIAALFRINQKGSFREMLIVDILGPNSKTPSLLNKITQTAKSLNVDYFLVMDNAYYFKNGLWSKGFIKKHEKNMVYLPIDPAYESKGAFEQWNLVASLHDSI